MSADALALVITRSLTAHNITKNHEFRKPKHMGSGSNNLSEIWQAHYGDVIMSAMVSQITSVLIVYSTVGWGADQRIYLSGHETAAVLLPGFAIKQSQNQVTRQPQFHGLTHIKAPSHWPLWGEFTGDQWIPYTK